MLYLYRDAEALDEASARAGEMREHGFAVERLDRAQLAQREPAIDASRLAGALYAPGDEAATRRASAASSPRAAARSA